MNNSISFFWFISNINHVNKVVSDLSLRCGIVQSCIVMYKIRPMSCQPSSGWILQSVSRPGNGPRLKLCLQPQSYCFTTYDANCHIRTVICIRKTRRTVLRYEFKVALWLYNTFNPKWELLQCSDSVCKRYLPRPRRNFQLDFNIS